MAQRPLSPHLTIWKWGPHMAVSILHRISGQGLAFVGLPVLLWWLVHLCSGIRHFVMDMGAGYEIDRNKMWSVVTLVLPFVLTAAFWAAVLLR
jgi:succinate dehydrogenase / fumarate reductase cytochrome b subunit